MAAGMSVASEMEKEVLLSDPQKKQFITNISITFSSNRAHIAIARIHITYSVASRFPHPFSIDRSSVPPTQPRQ
jgi:hypothetical protein